MEISIYSTIDFSKSRNLLTERQKNIKAFNPIVPEGGCISLLELNPLQYNSIVWTLINEKTGKITETTAESSDAMHYVAIPEGLRFGTYKLKIVTTRTVEAGILVETTISNPFEFVEASEDVVTIVSRNLENDLVGNVPPNATVISPIYVNPLKIIELADVDNTDIAAGKMLQVAEDGETHTYVDPPTSDAVQTLTHGATTNWDLSTGNIGILTLAGNTIIANPTHITAGQLVQLIVYQDGTGNRSISSFGSYYKLPGGVPIKLSSSPGAKDVITFRAESTTILNFENIVYDQQ